MDTTKLQALVTQLRALGVTKYVFNGATESVEIELGPEPAAPHAPNLAVEGFNTPTGRSPELDAMLSKLPPEYRRAFDVR